MKWNQKRRSTIDTDLGLTTDTILEIGKSDMHVFGIAKNWA